MAFMNKMITATNEGKFNWYVDNNTKEDGTSKVHYLAHKKGFDYDYVVSKTKLKLFYHDNLLDSKNDDTLELKTAIEAYLAAQPPVEPPVLEEPALTAEEIAIKLAEVTADVEGL